MSCHVAGMNNLFPTCPSFLARSYISYISVSFFRLGKGKSADCHNFCFRQGAQGILDRASNAQLDSEFGTHVIEDVAKVILEKGGVVKNKVGCVYSSSVWGWSSLSFGRRGVLIMML